MNLLKTQNYYCDENYIFFWSGCFSNWFKCNFNMEIDHRIYKFNCSEQALMLYKALFFNDQNIAVQIMHSNSPKEQKRLGRLVANYDDNKWADVRENIMINILIDKFTQNENLYTILKSTKNKIIVEASPIDTIWGIGMHVTQYPSICDKAKWKGENLLGECLMKVRNVI